MSSFCLHSGAEAGGGSGGSERFDLLNFCLNFGFDFSGVIEIVGHGCVGFGGEEVGMLVADFIDGPAVGEVVHDDLGDVDSGKTF